MSLPRTFCLSSASAALTPSTILTSFPNHYEVMKLSPSASTEDVKAQFRTLRGEYFASDAGKYRQLQTAYAVLVDSEARREYDELYRASMGLPVQPVANDPLESSGSASPSLRKSALVKAAVSRIDAQSQEPSREEQQRLAGEELRLRQEKENEEERRRRAEEQRQREADPNYGLKHFTPVYVPLIGSQPYHSYVPVAAEHEGMERKRKSRRPMYVGKLAAKAVP
ncbi:uncharacterized protein CC84DRAFT_1218580 [Paraphaeosphaeria sporulosa]|uniref:J domain-containing protein n=1 Tax=Paraphaeosphaeria sporulosa TaxID=1460663 RepID=A0A177CC33_9PLEO|nr:uncharacterized protein CC84DRAFT_1218580 [Paraphaeosphaeria sporulosa]OAG05213.1 hypothetical protein CC84DRAFT_1218580 [Paraphaeosphaeria sporulosa]